MKSDNKYIKIKRFLTTAMIFLAVAMFSLLILWVFGFLKKDNNHPYNQDATAADEFIDIHKLKSNDGESLYNKYTKFYIDDIDGFAIFTELTNGEIFKNGKCVDFFNKEIHLLNDLDFSEKNTFEVGDFSGVFKGNNHSLRNFMVEQGLFSSLYYYGRDINSEAFNNASSVYYKSVDEINGEKYVCVISDLFLDGVIILDSNAGLDKINSANDTLSPFIHKIITHDESVFIAIKNCGVRNITIYDHSFSYEYRGKIAGMVGGSISYAKASLCIAYKDCYVDTKINHRLYNDTDPDNVQLVDLTHVYGPMYLDKAELINFEDCYWTNPGDLTYANNLNVIVNSGTSIIKPCSSIGGKPEDIDENIRDSWYVYSELNNGIALPRGFISFTDINFYVNTTNSVKLIKKISPSTIWIPLKIDSNGGASSPIVDPPGKSLTDWLDHVFTKQLIDYETRGYSVRIFNQEVSIVLKVNDVEIEKVQWRFNSKINSYLVDVEVNVKYVNLKFINPDDMVDARVTVDYYDEEALDFNHELTSDGQVKEKQFTVKNNEISVIVDYYYGGESRVVEIVKNNGGTTQNFSVNIFKSITFKGEFYKYGDLSVLGEFSVTYTAIDSENDCLCNIYESTNDIYPWVFIDIQSFILGGNKTVGMHAIEKTFDIKVLWGSLNL